MDEQGEWVAVEYPSDDPDWNTGTWRTLERSSVFVDGVIVGPYDPIGWEKWVPAAAVPTEPGVYVDRVGDVWVLNYAGDWLAFNVMDWDEYSSGVTRYPNEYLPFRSATVEEKK